MAAAANSPAARAASLWWDVAAFAGGLGLAWVAKWETRDLVWSLWLSSLVVGFASIVWLLSEPLRELGANAAADRGSPGRAKGLAAVVLLVPFLFGLAFFAVHFGGFHFVHSVFLNLFFPIEGSTSFPGLHTYARVVGRYWMFLPLAFVAERQVFARAPRSDQAPAPRALAAPIAASRADLMAPYRNVIRMHLLIFFFAAAHALRWESFAVYGVVYAAYFFPWRVFRRASATPAST
jgi:hypothetical protein